LKRAIFKCVTLYLLSNIRSASYTLNSYLFVFSGELRDLMDRCPEGTYGYKCKFRCRCRDDEPCDKVTGSCYNGCAFGFWGPGCQLSKLYVSYSLGLVLFWNNICVLISMNKQNSRTDVKYLTKHDSQLTLCST